MFRTKSNIYDGAFFTLFKPYFRNILNSIELPSGFIFYTTNPLVKKVSTLKALGEKVYCEKWNIFFSKFKITQWIGVINKEGFLN